MIEEALNQVPNAVHFDTKRKEIEVTLFAGNLDFGAYAGDVIESLQKCLRRRIRVSKVVIPNSKGRTKGYAFVTLAWARDALWIQLISASSTPVWYQSSLGNFISKNFTMMSPTRKNVREHALPA